MTSPLAAKLAALARAFPKPAPRLRIFHADCGGIGTGELGKPLTCAECGAEMTAFISAKDEEVLRRATDESDALQAGEQ